MGKILIADSDLRNSELLANVLIQKDHEVITAANGRQVLAKASLFSPDLIILDTYFSDLSGFDVCKKIKNDPAGKYALILFLCALETKDANIKAFESGADDIVEKNSDALVLMAKVSSLLRISNLRNELEEKYNEIEKTNKILDFQLKMSQKIQRGIMRDYNINFKGVHLLTRYLPALDIGGDFYDLRTLGENKYALSIGDVSGHGISAALLTTMLFIMIKNISNRQLPPNTLLFTINNQFCDIFEGTNNEIYASLFCAVIDTSDRHIYYSNAGQTYPFFLSERGTKVSELAVAGTPVGIMKDSEYELKKIPYEKNDMLVLYTDGLCDNFFKDNPGKFEKKMSALLAGAHSFADLNEMQDSVIDMFYDNYLPEAKKYALDDVSLILVEFEE